MELNYFHVKPEGVGLWFRVGEEEGRCQVGVLAYLIGHRTILPVPIGKAFCWSQLCFLLQVQWSIATVMEKTSRELYRSLKAAPNFQRDSLFILYDPGIQHTVILPPCPLGQRPEDYLIHRAQQGCCSWKLKGGRNDCVVFERFEPIRSPSAMANEARRYRLKQ